MELTELDLEELARLIREGNTSGRLNSEGYYIAWELNTNIWADDN